MLIVLDFLVGSKNIWYVQVQEDRNHFTRVAGAVVCKVIEVSEIRWGDQQTYIQVIRRLQSSLNFVPRPLEVRPSTLGSSTLSSWKFGLWTSKLGPWRSCHNIWIKLNYTIPRFEPQKISDFDLGILTLGFVLGI